MLRVRTIYASGAGEAARYYAGYADYLDPEASHEAPGQWAGRQADGLGLSGPVTQDQLEQLLSGHDPITRTHLGDPFRDKITKHGTLIRAVGGYDATFSAPKSVSLWWGLTGDQGVLDAHNIAVQAALTHLETYGCTTRVWHNGRRMFPDAAGFTMAVFQQSTSREDDPQLHTHAVISSKVVAPDGRWMALDGHYLKKTQQALGRLYQSVLRAELTHRYGVTWEPVVKGQAEIDGIPDDLLEVFSKRAAQVEALREVLTEAFLEREGRDPTRREAAAIEREAAVDSRRAKTGLPVAEAQTRWIDEASALGWDGQRLARAITHQPQPERTQPTVDDILDTVTARSSTWGRADLLAAICDHTPPQPGYSGADWARALERAADRVRDLHRDLDPDIAGATRAGDGRSIWMDPVVKHLTHDRVLAQEERILTYVLKAQDRDPRPSATVDVTGLDPLQADVARAVAGTDQVVLVVGPAGAGKTTTLTAAQADLCHQHRPVYGIAPTGKAARVLEAETGIPADTIAKLLYEWDRPDGPGAAHRLPAGTTLVVDESGMAGTNTLDRVVGLARSQQWRLVLVGDPRQLQAVGRGGLFDELCRAGRTHHLQHIHRFQNRWEADATLGLRAGRIWALDAYVDHHRVHPDEFEGQLDRIADAWIHHHTDNKTVAVTAETNAHVDALNRAIQDTRRDHGHLDERGAAPIAGGETAGPGDHVVTRRNDRSLRTNYDEPVRNRELWTVETVNVDGSFTLSRQRGQGTVTVPADYARQHLRLGYAATAHGHQGDTVDVSYTLITLGTSHRALYVGATRGRTANHLAVVTDQPDVGHARDILEYVLTTDPADMPAITVRRDLEARGREIDPEPGDPLDAAERAVRRAMDDASPFEAAVAAAQTDLVDARSELFGLQRRHQKAGPLGRLRLRDQLADARQSLNQAQDRYAAALEDARPSRVAVGAAVDHRDRLREGHQAERIRNQLDALQNRAPARLGPELGLGL
jgi:conjugative relaxase-like TrwC/TraI family protein